MMTDEFILNWVCPISTIREARNAYETTHALMTAAIIPQNYHLPVSLTDRLSQTDFGLDRYCTLGSVLASAV